MRQFFQAFPGSVHLDPQDGMNKPTARHGTARMVPLASCLHIYSLLAEPVVIIAMSCPSFNQIKSSTKLL